MAEEVRQTAAQVRRLKSQLADAEGRAAAGKAVSRAERRAGNARLRVLLEGLQETVAGLSKELELPPGTPLPADLVAAVEPPESSSRLRLESGEELTSALGKPRAHLIIDGYNVTKTARPNDALADQREWLVRTLLPLQSRTGADITVIFDGASVGPVPSLATAEVRVRFSEPGEKADRVIVELARAEPSGRMVVVVSSDQAVASGARNAGARTAGSEVLLRVLGVGF